jgi:hypothetical protein
MVLVNQILPGAGPKILAPASALAPAKCRGSTSAGSGSATRTIHVRYYLCLSVSFNSIYITYNKSFSSHIHINIYLCVCTMINLLFCSIENNGIQSTLLCFGIVFPDADQDYMPSN